MIGPHTADRRDQLFLPWEVVVADSSRNDVEVSRRSVERVARAAQARCMSIRSVTQNMETMHLCEILCLYTVLLLVG